MIALEREGPLASLVEQSVSRRAGITVDRRQGVDSEQREPTAVDLDRRFDDGLATASETHHSTGRSRNSRVGADPKGVIAWLGRRSVSGQRLFDSLVPLVRELEQNEDVGIFCSQVVDDV